MALSDGPLTRESSLRCYHCGGIRLVVDGDLFVGRQAWSENEDVRTEVSGSESVCDAQLCTTAKKTLERQGSFVEGTLSMYRRKDLFQEFLMIVAGMRHTWTLRPKANRRKQNW